MLRAFGLTFAHPELVAARRLAPVDAMGGLMIMGRAILPEILACTGTMLMMHTCAKLLPDAFGFDHQRRQKGLGF
ncbi:hypothetical protein AA0323_0280 [Asaia siamensis NRIC 0323]|nr:hypothetical protein AA0323_0280 [Asaia siamensis NRIC 0323]